jgi:hypothetical protein
MEQSLTYSGSFGEIAFLMKKRSLIALVSLSALLSCGAELPGTHPIVVPEKGLLEKDHEALRLRWAEKHLLPGAEKLWQGQPWAEQAREVTQKGLKLWINGLSESPEEAKKTTATARALIKSECKEPLSCLMAHKILWGINKDWWGGHEGLSQAFEIIEDAQYLGALRAWIADEEIVRRVGLNRTINTGLLRQVHYIIDALGDASYSAEFETVLVRDFINWKGHTQIVDGADFQKLEKAIQSSPHSEWAKETMLGDLQVSWAWFARGTSWASEVKEEGWKGMEEHLEAAATHLQKAHDLRPDRPEAASQMIRVVMGGSEGPEELRAWFDRAIAAQFDYLDAYNGLIYASTKRWGGSDELILALGKRFAETERYDTLVPEQFFNACKQVAIESGNARRVFSSSEVKETALAYARGLLNQREANPVRAARNQGLTAVVAWLAGDDALAAKGLKATNSVLSASVTQDLSGLLHHAGTLRTSVFAANGGWGEEMRQLEHQYRHHDREAALKTLDALKPESLPSDTARTYAAEIRAVLELPGKLKQGGWHPLPIYPGLITCFCTGGSWRVPAPGELTVSGKDAAFLDLAFPVVVGKAFEIRGEISYELIPSSQWFVDWSFGPSLRWFPARHGPLQAPHAVRGLTHHPKKDPVEVQVTGVSNYDAKGTQKTELKAVNTFLASLNGEEMGYTLNETVVPPQNIESFKLRHSRGYVAFTGFNLPSGIKIKLKNIEVRIAEPVE